MSIVSRVKLSGKSKKMVLSTYCQRNLSNITYYLFFFFFFYISNAIFMAIKKKKKNSLCTQLGDHKIKNHLKLRIAQGITLLVQP